MTYEQWSQNGRLLVIVNAVRSGFSLFHKYFLITFTKKCL